MTTTTDLSALAGVAYDSFQRISRGEETITTLKDDAPEWIQDLVHEAHGGLFLPDDWRYDAICSALGAIHDGDGLDLDELGFEWADGYVDVYTHARLQWLASNLNRADYCDEAANEGLTAEDATLVERIGMGQYMEAREVFSAVLSALEEHAQEVADEDEEE